MVFLKVPPIGWLPERSRALRRVLAAGLAALLMLLLALLPAGADAARTTPETLYQRALGSRERLQASNSRKEYRHHWLNTIDLFRLVFETHPAADDADDAMLAVGSLYRGLSRRSGLPADLDMALYYFRRLVKAYPSSPLADDALLAVGEILLKDKGEPGLAALEFRRVGESYPKGNRAREAAALLKKIPRSAIPEQTAAVETAVSTVPLPLPGGRPAQVTGIRHWSNPTYTRVVVDLDGPVRFNPNFIRTEEAGGEPRLYIDMFGSTLGAGMKRPLAISDGLLKQARAGQFTTDTVRVVLDMERVGDYKVFALADPFRIVVDISGAAPQQAALPQQAAPQQAAATPADVARLAEPRRPPEVAAAARQSAPGPAPLPSGPLSLAQQLGMGVRRVVLDPGHGGHDPGAIGAGGLKEKDVVLDVALRLRRLLVEDYGLDVVLTRDTDAFIPLEERTAIANTSRADLFVSIHCNASRKKNLRGVETFFLNLASSRDAAETAARENMSSLATIADFEKTVVDLFMSMKIDESGRFARMAHDELHAHLRKGYKDTVDLGVRQAPFVVLIGAQMPSILSEISFIDHKIEGKRLAAENYRQGVAEALAAGISRYAGTVSLAAAR